MLRILLFAGVIFGLCLVASATTLNYPDFSSTSGLTLNGNAATPVTGDGTVLRLASAGGVTVGSAFTTNTISAATFSTAFNFRITDPGGSFDGTDFGADGLTFVVQSAGPNALGDAGQAMGYSGSHLDPNVVGIVPSVAVEFDTWYNWEHDPDSNHLGIDLNGTVVSVATVGVKPNFDDGNLWHAWIDYNGTTLEVRASQTSAKPASALLAYNVNIPGILGQDSAYVGFTGATWGGWGNHDIVNWTYSDTIVPLPTAGWLGLGLVGALAFRRQPRSF